MNSMIGDAAAQDIDVHVHVHALGERAVHETLNAIEFSRKANPQSSTPKVLMTLMDGAVVFDAQQPNAK